MSRNLELALTLKGRDELSRPVARAMQELTRQTTSAGKAVEGVAKSGADAMRGLAGQTKLAERSVIGLSRESQRMASAREQLGVRAEKAIQREIQQTEAAYNRLNRSGKLSANEQARAYETMRGKVAGLRRELQSAGDQQNRLVGGAKGLAAIAAGAWAGGSVLASPMRRVANYDTRLAQMANTAFNDTEVNGRKLSTDEQLQRRRTGKGELEGYIRTATQEGGTRDDNLAALDKLIARGIFSPQEAGKLLPMISKAATAAGSNAEEMTGVAMAAVQNAKIPVDQIPKALGMALRAGQMGGFELKDMATWLPKMLAMGGLSGLRGTDGLASILAASQLAVTAAGSTDEAGNNVVNFLQKITSADTANDFKKINARTMGNKAKGEKGIDLYGTLSQARAAGVDSVEAFTRLVGKVAAGDKEFTRLQQQVAAAKDDKEKSAMYGSMADILQARGVGKTIQDRQAMLTLLPILFDPQAYKKMKAGILQGSEQDVDINQLFMKEQAGFKFQQGQNTKEQGQYDAIGQLNNVVGDVVGKLAEYGGQYPALTASLVGATTAITALAAAAGAASLPMLLIRGGGAGSAVGGILPRAVAGLPALLRAGGGVGVAGAAGYGVGSLINMGITGLLTAMNGGKERTLGTWLYRDDPSLLAPTPLVKRNAPTAASPVPQLDLVQSAVNASTKLDLAAQKMQQATSQPIPIKITVDVQNGNIVAAVNAANAQTARRN